MKVIVCGGRNFSDEGAAFKALDRFHKKHPIHLVISGGCSGADSIGALWASQNLIHCATVSPIWETGRSAGPRRNVAMLGLNPDAVIAFPGGSGTAHMVGEAKAAGINVWEPMA